MEHILVKLNRYLESKNEKHSKLSKYESNSINSVHRPFDIVSNDKDLTIETKPSKSLKRGNTIDEHAS